MAGFEIITRAEQPTAVIHETVKTNELPQFFARAFGQVYGAMQAQGVAPVGPPFALYFGEPKETVEVEAGFPIGKKMKDEAGPVHGGKLPGGKCVHGMHVGPYETMMKTYHELIEYAGAKHLKPHHEMWECYLSDPKLEPDPQKWRTEIFWPVD